MHLRNGRRATGPATVLLAACTALALGGCASSAEQGAAESAGGAKATSGADATGTGSAAIEADGSEPTADGEAEGQETDFSRRLIPEAAIEHPEAPATPLVGRDFEGGERFRIENVPAGVTFHLVGTDPPTWEVRDAGGKRLALIQEQEWTETMQPEDTHDESAPLHAQAAGKVIHLGDWGGRPATIRTHQLMTTLRLYRIERRADGTDWITDGFRYEPTRVGKGYD